MRNQTILMAAIFLAAGRAIANPGLPAPEKPLPPIPSPAQVNLETATQNLMPLGPDEIRQLRMRLDEAKRAANSFPAPVPTTSSQIADFSPGSPPIAIRVAPFHGSTVNFVDVTGNPWPIVKAVNFDEAGIKIEVPVKDGSFLAINATGDYGTRNVSVFLKDLPHPVSLFVVGGQRETDFVKEVRIPRRGPNASNDVAIVPGEPMPVHEQVLNQLLDNIPPTDAVTLKTSLTYVRAWKLQSGKMVVRAPLMMLSPAYDATLRASDGTAVYSMQPVPVILLSNAGKIERVEIGGF